MAVLLSPVGGVAAQFFTNAGVPLSGGKIYTYAAGTSTPQATYTTGAGNIQHSNPIVLDAAGRVPTGEIWLTDGFSYKFVLKDANDVLIATYDNIVGINSNFVNFVNQQEIQTATAGQTVFTLTTMEYQPGTGNLSVFVDGVNQYGPGAQYAFTETSSTVVTFVSGLHVGASVKFTTTEIQNSGVADASQITYTYPAAGAVQESVESRLAQYVSVKDFGAVGDGVTDDTTAIQNAIDAAISNQQTLRVNAGTYKTTSTLNVVPPYGQGFIIQGDGNGQTVINAVHSGNAVISMIGATFCTISDLTLTGDSGSTFPKCGLITGRSSASSSGWHTFNKIRIGGNFSQACIYNIASEGNAWYDCVILTDATATCKYCVYVSGSDGLGIGGFTASSMLTANFYNIFAGNYAAVSNASTVFIQGAIQTGNINFYGGYLATSSGSYVTIDSGTQDGQDSRGPFIFDGIGGEIIGSANNINGFNITSTGVVDLHELSIRNCWFIVGSSGIGINQESTVGMVDCDVEFLPFKTGSSIAESNIAPSTLNNFYVIRPTPSPNGNNINSNVDVGNGIIPMSISGLTLSGTWTNTFGIGNNYGVVGYYADQYGNVYLSGAPGAGTLGTTIATLPAEMRPTYNKTFAVQSNTGLANVMIDASTGAITHVSGGVDPVYLNGISFMRGA